MITLLFVVLELSLESRIKLPILINVLLVFGIILAILTIVYLVLKGYCETLIALFDLVAAFTTTVLFLKQLYTK